MFAKKLLMLQFNINKKYRELIIAVNFLEI